MVHMLVGLLVSLCVIKQTYAEPTGDVTGVSCQVADLNVVRQRFSNTSCFSDLCLQTEALRACNWFTELRFPFPRLYHIQLDGYLNQTTAEDHYEIFSPDDCIMSNVTLNCKDHDPGDQIDCTLESQHVVQQTRNVTVLCYVASNSTGDELEPNFPWIGVVIAGSIVLILLFYVVRIVVKAEIAANKKEREFQAYLNRP
jgi:hypothetical protein